MSSENTEPLACSTSNMYQTEVSVQFSTMTEADNGTLASSFLAEDSLTSLDDLLCVAIALMEQQEDGPIQDDEEQTSGA
eukprot:scaffold25998_cov122-Cylindrotheca_fusiformis.AAC.3